MNNLSNGLAAGHVVLGKAALAAGTTTTHTVGQFDYAIDGVIYRKAAAANAATPTTDALTGAAFKPLSADQACAFVFGINAAGAVAVAQSKIVKNSELGAGGTAAIELPALPDSHVAFGYLLARADTTLVGTWTFGTNNLSGVTGMTYTFRDVIAPPSQAIAS